MRRTLRSLPLACLARPGAGSAGETWRGLAVAPERRCAPCDRDEYPYEARIVEGMGGPTEAHYASRRETDVERLVAVSEAHDSGLCAASLGTERRFARDLGNPTPASPRVNRHEKSGKDADEWLPERNRCWFTARVVAVKRKYALTVDRREARALEQVLAGCASTEMVGAEGSAPTRPAPGGAAGWDTDGNARITCHEAREHGIAPVRRGRPAYRLMRDGDGVVCE